MDIELWKSNVGCNIFHTSNTCCNVSEEYGPTLRKAHDFLKASQVVENPSGEFKEMYRHICKGSWAFSMHDQGWQVSDCTAEGLKVLLIILLVFQNMHACLGDNHDYIRTLTHAGCTVTVKNAK